MTLAFRMADQRGEADTNFLFEAIFDALFEVLEADPVPPLDQFVQKNAPATIFPFVRELLANTTARSELGPLVMPMINFVDLAAGVPTPLLRLGEPVAPEQVVRRKKTGPDETGPTG